MNRLEQRLTELCGCPVAQADDQTLYRALLMLVREKSRDKRQVVHGRKLYYISAEFLIGKLLSNNLINLGIYDEVRAVLQNAGKDL